MQASRLYIACSEAVALRMCAIKAWCVCAAQYCQLTILYSKFTINSPIDTFILPKVFLIPSRQKEAAELDAEPAAEHGGGGAAEVDASTTPSPAVYDWRQEKINWWWRVVGCRAPRASINPTRGFVPIGAAQHLALVDYVRAI